jgi:MFS family permease
LQPTHTPAPGEPAPPERDAGAAEAEFRRQVDRDLPRNFTAHLIHGLAAQTGFRLVQAPTFLPAYVFALSGSSTIVGVARSCQAFGMFLTPIVGATLIEHRRRVLPMVFATGAAMRLSVLGMALAGFFLGTQANLIAICLCLGLQGFFTGMQSVTFSFLTSKVIPVEKRGAVGGVRNALANVAALGTGYLGGFLVERNALGNGYASVFLVSFTLAAAGLMVMLTVREPESPEVKAQQKLGARLRELPALLRTDPHYRAYLWARAVGAGGRMALPFYFVFASEQGDLPVAAIGYAHIAYSVGQGVSNLPWGLLGDRRGFRGVLASSLTVWACATVALMYGHGLVAMLVAFAAIGAGQCGFELACTNLVLEFGARQDLPMRIALAQSAEQLVQIIAPVLGGLLIAALSYHAMFWTAVVLQLAAFCITVLRLDEPRTRRLPPATVI